MKTLFAAAILGILSFASCAQKEEKREDYKDAHSVEERRNAGVDSAAFEKSRIRCHRGDHADLAG